MAQKLTPVKVFPTGMRLNEYVALEEGFFLEEGLEVEILWDVLRGQMVRWSDTYKERPQDRPFVDGEQTIGSACAWGSISNAGAGMGKFVPDVHGVSPWGIFVRPDSEIRKPEDLKDVPIAVGLRAGSHFNVPYRLEKYLPLDNIKPVNVGGFGARLKALVDGEFEAVSLLPPQLDMAAQLGMRAVITDEFKTLWWVDERWDAENPARLFPRAGQGRTGDHRRHGSVSAAVALFQPAGVRGPRLGLQRLQPGRALRPRAHRPRRI